MKKMAWVLGWAVPNHAFTKLVRAVFPECEHVVVMAHSNALERLEAVGPFDWVVGYSLGSLLLLKAAERAQRLGRVVLLAPVFAFTSEKNVGGRVPLAQLRQLRRWLRSDPLAALKDFYRRVGLDVPVERPSDVELAGLLWGLERLECEEAEPSLPNGWRAWCGGNDPLLDAARLQELVPEVVLVWDAGHSPAALLRAFAEVVT